MQRRNQFATKELAIRSHSVEESNTHFSSIITLSGSSVATSEDDSIPIQFGPTRVISDQNIMENRRAKFFPAKKDHHSQASLKQWQRDEKLPSFDRQAPSKTSAGSTRQTPFNRQVAATMVAISPRILT